MQKRPALHCERLERRELPANSFSTGILPVDIVRAAPLEAPAVPPSGYTLQGPTQDARRETVESGLNSDAVGALFAEHGGLSGLFPPSAESQAKPTFESIPSAGWDSSLLSFPATRVSDEEVWSFLQKYASKAIRREEHMRGPLPDHADIVQQIYVEWREAVTAASDVHARLLDPDSVERGAFRGAVRRVLDRSRYDAVKQRRRGEFSDHDEPQSATARDWADLEIDLSQGIAQLTAREREILDLRRGGMTFDEIGAKMGMPRQRIFEVYAELMDRLTTIYCD